ncbi:MAG: hypothetical protein AUJ92_18140 [Armatimonadetes bacterium CG2_30_59_28]|nr:methyltransferase domain-containing protein [Armatimonadota bacterium]OIO90719.1 MAG: hypothetical protein AUJ92_18140 [Armatimonadetes bacterium CG2_30_59_28]PIU63238.1 MAG: hypothetical protein COS85_16440 [Armatimonadetes bacterium CG07_land_8_20_14_0_80_59_28]
MILFLELACIRFLPAYVKLLSYFANTVLLASFLGMSVGCLTSRRKTRLIHAVPALLFVVATLAAVFWVLGNFEKAAIRLSPQSSQTVVFFGADQAAKAGLHLSLEVVLSVAFMLVSVIFIGLGQVMGGEFDRHPPIRGYTLNILGSLAGILIFTAMSSLSLPPVVWFGVASVVLIPWLRGPGRRYALNVGLLAISLLVMFLLDYVTSSPRGDAGTIWSPYYKIRYASRYNEKVALDISVNEIGHQYAGPVSGKPTIYSLPYGLLGQTEKTPREILVIGAGSGNDVAAALQHGATHVDAVEIDPRILELGKRYHPDRPYDDPRVRVAIDDGRSFVRQSDKQYDMIVYALVDSLTLMSSYSSVRLETYLFTRQAFQDIRRHLQPGGVFVVYNYFRENWLALRISKMLAEVFGREPVVMTFPATARISIDQPSSGNAFSMFIAGDTDALLERFADGEVYLFDQRGSARNGEIGAFASRPPHSLPPNVEAVTPSALVTSDSLGVATDDWPFLYLRERTMPAYLLRSTALVILIAIVLLFTLGRGELRERFSGHFFFLGAAFMLLETRSVTSLALVYGSTWRVNAIVFFSILVMILLANLYVLKRPTHRTGTLYALLFVALILNYALPPHAFLSLSSLAGQVVTPAVVALPILLAALVFANSFRVSGQPSADIGWNIAGVMVGGLCENLSLLIGFQNLLLVAVLFYLISALTRPAAASAGCVNVATG